MTTDGFPSGADTYPNGAPPANGNLPKPEGMTLSQVQAFTKVESPSLDPEFACAAEGQGMGFGLDANDGGEIEITEKE